MLVVGLGALSPKGQFLNGSVCEIATQKKVREGLCY